MRALAADSSIGCLEAESAFLGCLLAGGMTGQLLALVELEDFTDPRHRAVLAAARALHQRSEPVDPLTVLAALRRTGLERSLTADRSAGVFLTDLLTSAPSLGSASYYARMLLEHRARRQVHDTGTRWQQAAPGESMESLRALVVREVAEVARQLQRLDEREQQAGQVPA